MNINTAQLRKFMKYAAAVKHNVLYDSLDTILVESTGNEVRFTKTNYNVYCRYEYAATQPVERILVLERILVGFLATTAAEVFDLDVGLERITITDGKPIYAPIIDPETYPLMPKSDGEPIKLDCVEQLKIAGKFMSQDKYVTAKNFVDAGKKGIFATDGNTMYHYKCEMPELLLDNDVMSFLSQTQDKQEVYYYRAGNHDFFISEGVKCGFISHTFDKVDYSTFIVRQEGDKITVLKSDLDDFCIRVAYASKEEFPTPILHGSLELEYQNADFNISCNSKIACEGGPADKFKFSLLSMKNLLNSLPYERLTFTKFGPHFQVTTPNDENYTGILAGLNLQNTSTTIRNETK